MTITPTSPATLRERLREATDRLVYVTLEAERAGVEALADMDLVFPDDPSQLAKERRAILDALHDEAARDAERPTQSLHAAASDLEFVASGGECDPRTLMEHATELRSLAARSSALPETTDDAE